MRWHVVILGMAALVAGVVVVVGVLAMGDVVRLLPWQLRGDPDSTATSVPLTVLGGGCGADSEKVARVEVQETAQQVTISTYLRKDRVPVGQACTAVGTAHDVTAHLDQPLGGWRLVDAACVGSRSHLQCGADEW